MQEAKKDAKKPENKADKPAEKAKEQKKDDKPKEVVVHKMNSPAAQGNNDGLSMMQAIDIGDRMQRKATH